MQFESRAGRSGSRLDLGSDQGAPCIRGAVEIHASRVAQLTVEADCLQSVLASGVCSLIEELVNGWKVGG